jgi:hypothetical protein
MKTCPQLGPQAQISTSQSKLNKCGILWGSEKTAQKDDQDDIKFAEKGRKNVVSIVCSKCVE